MLGEVPESYPPAGGASAVRRGPPPPLDLSTEELIYLDTFIHDVDTLCSGYNQNYRTPETLTAIHAKVKGALGRG